MNGKDLDEFCNAVEALHEELNAESSFGWSIARFEQLETIHKLLPEVRSLLSEPPLANHKGCNIVAEGYQPEWARRAVIFLTRLQQNGCGCCACDGDVSELQKLLSEPPLKLKHRWGYCNQCDCRMVICGKCGNKCCNGRDGIDAEGKKCDACQSAYDLQALGEEAERREKAVTDGQFAPFIAALFMHKP